jgi:hypothetical protein
LRIVCSTARYFVGLLLLLFPALGAEFAWVLAVDCACCAAAA